VQRDVAERLRIQLILRPTRLGCGAGLVDLAVARHQVERQVDTENELIQKPVVELERALERVVDQLRRLLADVFHAEQRAAVIDHQAEADVAIADDVRPVRRKQSFGVNRRTKEVGIETAPVRVRNRILRIGSARKSERADARDRERHTPTTQW
jgi:hypothetical protein